jgi:lysyl-tRNA synthetase, class I
MAEKKEKEQKSKSSKKTEKADPSKKKVKGRAFYHWADQMAAKICAKFKDEKTIHMASGITPSGTVHIGNFREVITVELIKRAVEKQGKKVSFLYSWDDYDVFRKVPKNMPKPELLKTYLRKPIVDVPDTFDCEHASYAEHNEKQFEEQLGIVGITPQFVYQSKKYRSGTYAEMIIKANSFRESIREILNKFRKEDLPDDWFPVSVYCDSCNSDETHITSFKGHFLAYVCRCGHSETVDVSKSSNVKLPWRVDWPMRWALEKIMFEPGGKDHSTQGGSYDTAKEIVALFNWEAPLYLMYDFVRIKGGGGKISSSKGDVITVTDALDVYEPSIIRWLFAGSRPGSEFAIAFDLDVIKVYEDFDKCERIYFGEHKVSDKEFENQKRVYELSCVSAVPKTLPYQPSFRHLTNVLLMNDLDIDKSIGYYEKELKSKNDKERLRTRAECAVRWLEKYAPDDFTFSINKKTPVVDLSKEQIKALKDVAKALKAKEWEDKDLHEELYVILTNHKLDTKTFFTAAYQVLISKDKGPKLAAFLIEIKERAIVLFEGL